MKTKMRKPLFGIVRVIASVCMSLVAEPDLADQINYL